MGWTEEAHQGSEVQNFLIFCMIGLHGLGPTPAFIFRRILLAPPAGPAPWAGRCANGPALWPPGLASRQGDGPCLTTLEVR